MNYGKRKIVISQRKLESYKQAEKVCRELRYQISDNNIDLDGLAGLLLKWMDKTGKIKYERP